MNLLSRAGIRGPERCGDTGGVVLRTGLAGSRVVWCAGHRKQFLAGGGRGRLGAEIGRVLGDDSGVTMLAPSVLADADQAALSDALAGVSHVLYAPEVSSSGLGCRLGISACSMRRRRLTAAMTAMAAMTLPPRLFLLTRNAQPVGEGDRANPAHAVLWGLGRTLALEHPEIWGAILDVDESVPAELAARYVLAEAHSGDGEDQVVYRAGVRRVPRLQSGLTRPRPRLLSWTKTAAIWSSARPATSGRI